jgi:hypothetical protein
VPGGTGYLAELADPETLRTILYRAYEVVRDCPCAEEGRSSCHRCLLPFAGPSNRLVSRLAAERHLRDLLNGVAGTQDEPEPQGAWDLTEDESAGFDPETHIEQKFRQVLRQRLEALGATLQEHPGPHGNRLRVTLGGGRVWTLDPQEHVLGSRPDFMLRSNDTTVPEVAIFCDGWKFHASPSFNRLADDAEKRRDLRDGGYVVLGVSWKDLESDAVETPPWLNETMIGVVTAQSGGKLSPSVIDLLRRGPMDFLTQWIQSPEPDALSALSDWLPMFLLGRVQHMGVAGGHPVDQEAAEVLGGAPLAGTPPSAWAWQRDTVVLYARQHGTVNGASEVGLVLDDRDDRLGPEHADAWRAWLRFSNYLNLRKLPTSITVSSLVGSQKAAAVGAEAEDEVPAELREDYDLASMAERRFMLQIHAAGLPRATYGFETESGLPLSISWPDQQVAVAVEMEASDVRELVDDGWRVVEPDVEALREALLGSGSG